MDIIFEKFCSLEIHFIHYLLYVLEYKDSLEWGGYFVILWIIFVLWIKFHGNFKYFEEFEDFLKNVLCQMVSQNF